jgi:hypothetical protein
MEKIGTCRSRDLFLVLGSNPHTSHGLPVDRFGTDVDVDAVGAGAGFAAGFDGGTALRTEKLFCHASPF